MPSRRTQEKWIALSLCAGAWHPDEIAGRIARSLSLEEGRARQLAARLIFAFDANVAPEARALRDFIQSDALIQKALEKTTVQGPLLDPPTLEAKPSNLVTFALPELPTWRAVGLWLCLFDEELAWFADWRGQQHRVTEAKLHHYRYAWLRKRSGGLRLIEIPKGRLKAIQRTLLHKILNRVPPHPSAHGFTRGRSIRTFTRPHVGKEALLRLDLKAFFHSVPTRRVYALFRRLGYPRTVSRLLQGLCCQATSPALAGPEFERLPSQERQRLTSRHLPQGSPTSGVLANLCSWGLDCRLQGLADRYGYAYTRYADDIAFSGSRSLARRAEFLQALVGAIAHDEGFAVNHRKTRLRLASQRQFITGIVVNQTTNFRRKDFDRLKAMLHNCVCYGPESQNHEGHSNFRAHLEGRVAHVVWLNPARGRKLEALLAKIDWSQNQ